MPRLGSDISLAGVTIRLELLPIAVAIALLSGVDVALALAIALLVHELGHLAAARAAGARASRLTLQLGGGGAYARPLESSGLRIAVLAAGPAATALLAAAACVSPLPAFLRQVPWAAAVWSVYQLAPFPPLDGGRILQLALEGRGVSATRIWFLGWALGAGLAVLIVVLDGRQLAPVVLLSGIALILGRAEAGYVRHVDAYAAWERGDHRAVIAVVRRLPDYLERSVRTTILELGVMSAMEVGEIEALVSLTAELPASRPVVMRGAEWLLGRGREEGAKLAQRALDALDAEVVRPEGAEREPFADLAFRYAVHEAAALRPESALGLLERAVDLGFADVDRLEADATLAGVRIHPRYATIRARLGSA